MKCHGLGLYACFTEVLSIVYNNFLENRCVHYDYQSLMPSIICGQLTISSTHFLENLAIAIGFFSS